MKYNPRLPAVADMERSAQKRIPRFAWEYLSSGISAEHGLQRNRSHLDEIQLWPKYLTDVSEINTSCNLFGQQFDLGLGISPVGLSNMMWPTAERELAKAAQATNIPYTLSTMGTTSLEEIAEIAPDVAWFQLYVPQDREVMKDLIKRVKHAGYKVLIITVDIPVGAKRDKELKNGLILPFKYTPRIVAQTLGCPVWLLKTIKQGIPRFVNLEPYSDLKHVNHLSEFLTQFFMTGVTIERIREIRELWDGPLVVKGLLRSNDIQQCKDVGADGVVVSNHGGRQLDGAPSSVRAMQLLGDNLKSDLTILMDSGIRTGLDVIRCKALGANAAFSGRSFLFAMAGAGDDGGRQVIEIFRDEICRSLQQIGCTRFAALNDTWLQP